MWNFGKTVIKIQGLLACLHHLQPEGRTASHNDTTRTVINSQPLEQLHCRAKLAKSKIRIKDMYQMWGMPSVRLREKMTFHKLLRIGNNTTHMEVMCVMYREESHVIFIFHSITKYDFCKMI